MLKISCTFWIVKTFIFSIHMVWINSLSFDPFLVDYHALQYHHKKLLNMIPTQEVSFWFLSPHNSDPYFSISFVFAFVYSFDIDPQLQDWQAWNSNLHFATKKESLLLRWVSILFPNDSKAWKSPQIFSIVCISIPRVVVASIQYVQRVVQKLEWDPLQYSSLKLLTAGL